jgi:hypothetical protein
MGSTSTATSTSTTAVNVKAQVDVHRTLAHLRQGSNPLIETPLELRVARRAYGARSANETWRSRLISTERCTGTSSKPSLGSPSPPDTSR